MDVRLDKFFRKNRSIILAYDHGMEHGPVDFNQKNIDPAYIMEIAEKGRFNGIALQHGIAEHYYDSTRVPLIVKLNGKTNLADVEPYSSQLCSVQRALKLGADAVGYTLYVGSNYESTMFEEFSNIVENAHNVGVPVIAWVYPRGASVKDPMSTDTLAYAARVGLELGADAIKIKYNNDFEGFKWVIKAAGKSHVYVAGGSKQDDYTFLKNTYEVLEAGACGLAVGRNIWKREDPYTITKALRKVVFDKKTPEEALQ